MGVFKMSTGDSWKVNAANPNPSIFKIKRCVDIGKNCVALINYPGCNNFEGNKIIVFENWDCIRLRAIPAIDPHFYPQNRIVARFRPDERGWKLACLLAENLNAPNQ